MNESMLISERSVCYTLKTKNNDLRAKCEELLNLYENVLSNLENAQNAFNNRACILDGENFDRGTISENITKISEMISKISTLCGTADRTNISLNSQISVINSKIEALRKK